MEPCLWPPAPQWPVPTTRWHPKTAAHVWDRQHRHLTSTCSRCWGAFKASSLTLLQMSIAPFTSLIDLSTGRQAGRCRQVQSRLTPADVWQKAGQLTLSCLIKAAAGLCPPCSQHWEAATRAARCRTHACPPGSSPQTPLLPLWLISRKAAAASQCCHNNVMACMQYRATVWLLQKDGRCYSWGCARHRDYMCLQAQLWQACTAR